MKKGIVCLSILALLALMTLSACSQPAPAPAPAPQPAPGSPSAKPAPAATPTPSTAPKPAAGAVTLKLTTFSPTGKSTVPTTLQWFADEVQKRSNGQVKIDIFWGGTLAAANEGTKATGGGLADFVHTSPTHTPDLIPFAAAGYDFMPLSGYKDAVGAFVQIRKEMPAASEDFTRANTRLVGLWQSGAITVINRVRPINTSADLKGLKIACSGALNPKILGAAEAVPVSLVAAETYDAMSKGVIDGGWSSIEVVSRYKLYEIAKNVVFVGPSGSVGHIILEGLGTFKKLAPEQQQVIDQVGSEVAAHYAALDKVDDDANMKTLTNAGVAFTTLSKSDWEAWRAKISRPLYEELVKRTEQLGYPNARAVYDRWTEIQGFKP